MEFVLTLNEALARLPTQPTPEELRMAASTFLIPLEYETLNRIPCPRCAGHDWEQTMRASLVGRTGLEWPYLGPAGDEHHCQCKSCGYSMKVTFWFTK